MTTHLMIDSGAYTAWTAGVEIDVADYALWCSTEAPDASYYINLDVIPKKGASSKEVDAACWQGWENYQMLGTILGFDRVLPVYHLQDPLDWLRKYLHCGSCKYLALGGLALSKERERFEFLEKIKWIVGDVQCKLHGLAVTSHSVLTGYQWYSVDSSSWKHIANWGSIWVPRKVGRRLDYTAKPVILGMSPMSSTRTKHQAHAQSFSPMVRDLVSEYVDEAGVGLGESIIFEVAPGYKLRKKPNEIWYDKKNSIVLHPLEEGVSNSFEKRCQANIHYVKKASQAIGTKIYLAGNPLPYELEYQMGRRLLSYHYILGYRGNGARCLTRHLQEVNTF